MISAGMQRVDERFLTTGCSEVLSQLYVSGIDIDLDEGFQYQHADCVYAGCTSSRLTRDDRW